MRSNSNLALVAALLAALAATASSQTPPPGSRGNWSPVVAHNSNTDPNPQTDPNPRTDPNPQPQGTQPQAIRPMSRGTFTAVPGTATAPNADRVSFTIPVTFVQDPVSGAFIPVTAIAPPSGPGSNAPIPAISATGAHTNASATTNANAPPISAAGISSPPAR